MGSRYMPKKTSPVTLSWVEFRPGYKVPIFYNHHGMPIDAFHDRIVQVAKEQIRFNKDISSKAYQSAVEKETFSLKALAEFLATKNKSWEQMDDQLLEEFRDWELERVLGKSNSRGLDKPTKRTVNTKLRCIYQYYMWAQDAKYINDVIGTDHPITSRLADISRAGNGKAADWREKNLYPLIFKRVGEASRTRKQYSATAKDKKDLIQHFTENSSPFVAERNILIMELADQVAWRRGSISYLTIDQFNSEAIHRTEEDTITVTPRVQKFGYEYSFPVPIGLAVRIARYIDKVRAQWIADRSWTEKLTQNRIFLTSNGSPLEDRRITRIFSDAFKSIGAPQNQDAGVHSFRRKSAQDTAATELEARQERGLSTAMEDINHVLAIKLGQANIGSPEPYIKATRDSVKQSNSAKLQQIIVEHEAELSEARLEIQRLRKALEQKLD